MPPKRAGKQQVNEEEIEDGHQEGATADPSTEPASHTTPSLAELANLLRGLVKKQQEHDAKWEQDKLQQEDRWQSMERRVEQLQQEVKAEHPDLQPVLEGAAAAPVAVPVSPALGSGLVRIPSWKGPKMQPYQEDEDIEHYLTTFERIATACQWPHEEWALHLAPLLNGRARAAYVAMDITETMDYDKVKKAVLEKFEISAETYRVRFRSSVVREDESPKELQSRLKDLFDKWMTPREKTKEQIGDAIVLEQFLRMQTPDLRTWIKERNPTTSREAAELAEAFLSARRPFKSSFSTKPSSIPPPVSKLVGGNGYKNKAPRPPFTNVTGPRFKEFKHKGPVVCHSCGQPGHIKPECPVQQVSKTYMCFAPQPQCVLEEVSPPIGDEERTVCVIIDDKPHVALLDSGSSRTLIREDCLPRDVTFCGKVKVWCVHGDNVDYPVANVNIQVEGQQYLLSVGVMSKLPYQVILGWDLPVLRELLAKSNDKDNIIPVESLAVVTRSSHKQRVEPECGDGDWDLPFQDCIVPDSGCSTKGPRKSKSQKRQEKVKGTKMVESVSAPISDKLMIIPDDLVKLQREDPTLAPLFAKCVPSDTQVTDRVREVFFVKDDQLYRRSKVGDQLVVPKDLRPTVLHLAHSVPWAGHLGHFKTFSRMVPRFYWPQQFSDTVQYCKSCPQCQLTAPAKKSDRAPLITMPIIDTPFSRIAMDIVGPLERSSAGHKYILVLCDYATKYPEAFPLRKIKARQIANCLIQMFSRVGIPREIITDQGTNFTSTLLREVYKLLGITGIKTTPYHPQTDGLVERFNKTLKSMLKKFVEDSGADWDQWLPFLLFAYREVPQASTGFSPFQLLYGHVVRGPLDVLKEAWEAPNPEKPCNVLSYVLKMRDKLEQMQQLANIHLSQAQKKQKLNYDKAARRRSFREGQKVLLLLPTSECGLLAKWQGPYEVSRKVGPVTYELYMPDRRKKHQIFHINLLKEWNDRASSMQLWARAVAEEDECQELFFPSTKEEQTGPDLSHLSPDQQEELQYVMDPALFSTKPGCTDLIQHDIHLRDPNQQPIRDTTSRIPAKLIPAVKQEVEDMLAMGVIEPSKSEWCSPVVLVPKKNDPRQRFCVNFSKLNAVSAFDAYPMPRVEELIERLGNAKFLTTLDLCKGYWQVPLTETSKNLTAFRVPSGLYQFKTMPFGLHGAPATFQRLVDEVLRGADSYSAAYIDDIVVFSESWGDHIKHLNDVFNRIERAGLVMNARKCHIAKTEVEYLGYIIGGGVIRPQTGGPNSMNRDEGAYTLSHTWDSVLEKTPGSRGRKSPLMSGKSV
ncbi:hypothetical protein WMY93_019270 [Mugilogobius chulae]|uniref:Gypsy retrotransposon integrase-like protein 1 n=1 Tax=Mugilogobius chulae TaxID=88201 RepID=A0AAW0NIA1_9GOBI